MIILHNPYPPNILLGACILDQEAQIKQKDIEVGDPWLHCATLIVLLLRLWHVKDVKEIPVSRRRSMVFEYWICDTYFHFCIDIYEDV